MQQIQIQIGPFGGPPAAGVTQGFPELVDAKGAKFEPVQVPARRMQLINGAMTQETTVIFRGQDGQGEPDRLVVHGSRMVNVTIPFAFQNVPLE
jgi:hypothetical protein